MIKTPIFLNRSPYQDSYLIGTPIYYRNLDRNPIHIGLKQNSYNKTPIAADSYYYYYDSVGSKSARTPIIIMTL